MPFGCLISHASVSCPKCSVQEYTRFTFPLIHTHTDPMWFDGLDWVHLCTQPHTCTLSLFLPFSNLSESTYNTENLRLPSRFMVINPKEQPNQSETNKKINKN